MQEYKITTLYGTFGLEVNENKVVEKVDIIAKWMKGKDLDCIKEWTEKKRGKLQAV